MSVPSQTSIGEMTEATHTIKPRTVHTDGFHSTTKTKTTTTSTTTTSPITTTIFHTTDEIHSTSTAPKSTTTTTLFSNMNFGIISNLNSILAAIKPLVSDVINLDTHIQTDLKVKLIVLVKVRVGLKFPHFQGSFFDSFEIPPNC